MSIGGVLQSDWDYSGKARNIPKWDIVGNRAPPKPRPEWRQVSMTTSYQENLFAEHSWARDLMVEKFRSEIRCYLNSELVIRRVRKKAYEGDDLYEAMLSSADRISTCR